jgi:hypothetical protein
VNRGGIVRSWRRDERNASDAESSTAVEDQTDERTHPTSGDSSDAAHVLPDERLARGVLREVWKAHRSRRRVDVIASATAAQVHEQHRTKMNAQIEVIVKIRWWVQPLLGLLLIPVRCEVLDGEGALAQRVLRFIQERGMVVKPEAPPKKTEREFPRLAS